MELEKYIELATRTESRLDELVGNPQLIVNLLNIFVCAGNMLDQVKKHTFYGKEYDTNKFNGDFQSIINTLQHLTIIQINGTKEDMGEEVIPEIDPRIFHAVMGIATEASEMSEALYKALTNQGVDLVNLREENGDLNWYQAIFYDAMKELGYEGTWDDDLEKNIAKLNKIRYPDGFDKDKAINRDLKKEREILEEVLEDKDG